MAWWSQCCWPPHASPRALWECLGLRPLPSLGHSRPSFREGLVSLGILVVSEVEVAEAVSSLWFGESEVPLFGNLWLYRTRACYATHLAVWGTPWFVTLACLPASLSFWPCTALFVPAFSRSPCPSSHLCSGANIPWSEAKSHCRALHMELPSS